MTPQASIIADLGQKCDRRTEALRKAVDALEEMRDILFKSRRKWDDRQRLLFKICESSLQQIEMHIEEKGDS